MRYYSVPFSTKEEERFLGLTLREAAWTFGGLFCGSLVATAIGFFFKKFMFVLLVLFSVPLGLTGLFVSRWPVRKGDFQITLDRYMIKEVKFKNRTHVYLYKR